MEDRELLSLTDNYAKEAYVILSQLNEKERALLSMRFAEDLTYKQMAERLGSNDKAVAKQVERLLKKCRELSVEEVSC